MYISVQFSSVQLLSFVWLLATPWTTARQTSLSITNSQILPKLMSIELVMPSNDLILFHSLLLLPSIFPSNRVFSNESAFGIRWPKFGVSASISVLPMNTQDWSPLGCIGRDSQESSPTPQYKRINYSVFSFLYSPTLTSIHDHWKKHSLDKWTFVGKAMCLLFNMLSRLGIPFFPMSKCLLILWLQSPSAVILEPKKIKSAAVSTVSPSICHEVMGPEAMILVFWMLSFKLTFHSPLSLSSRGSLVPLCFLP